MKNQARFLAAILLVFGFLFNNLPFVKACGPFTVDPLFSFTKHAPYPLESFINGKVGVVPNSYGRISLFVFYRQLVKLPFSAEEQKQVDEVIKRRIGIHWSDDDPAQPVNPPNQTGDIPDALAKWKDVRNKIVPKPVDISTEKSVPEYYFYYENCLQDSFDTAAETLEKRIAEFGISENTKEWVKGQDAVFSNCDSGGTMPETPNANFPEWLMKDRQYQIAAAHFYASQLPEARSNFQQIADDNNSVWNKTAKYVVARTYIRQASFIEISESSDESAEQKAQNDQKFAEKAELLQKAEMQLRSILNDNSMGEFHNSAQTLLNIVKYRSNPLERQRELAKNLSTSNENLNIFDDLTDYIWLLDKPENEARQIGPDIDQKEAEAAGKKYNYDYKLKLRDLAKNVRENDLSDWLYTYQAADGFAHAFDKWQKTKSLHWFIAAISHAEKDSPQTAELLSEAAKISQISAGFVTARYHQIRLLLDSGKRAEAKRLLDEILNNNFQSFPISTRNEFYAQRMILAENLTEFLKYARRKAATFVWSDDVNEEGDDLKANTELLPWKNRTMFDEDATAFLNEKMPLSMLREAALSPQLPDYLKKFVVEAVWTRAILLKNEKLEREFTPLMSRYAKEFSPLFSKYAAANPVDREAAALLVILNYPVIQPYVPVGFGREKSPPTSIDSTRGNWWCAEDENNKSADDYDSYDHYKFNYPKIYPNFLTAEQTSEAAREQIQIQKSGNSATFLARRAVEFAARNPIHRQTPEILHLAVRSTRYGCTDSSTEKFSKEAFTILHKRYPNSEWTGKTPYWFK